MCLFIGLILIIMILTIRFLKHTPAELPSGHQSAQSQLNESFLGDVVSTPEDVAEREVNAPLTYEQLEKAVEREDSRTLWDLWKRDPDHPPQPWFELSDIKRGRYIPVPTDKESVFSSPSSPIRDYSIWENKILNARHEFVPSGSELPPDNKIVPKIIYTYRELDTNPTGLLLRVVSSIERYHNGGNLVPVSAAEQANIAGRFYNTINYGGEETRGGGGILDALGREKKSRLASSDTDIVKASVAEVLFYAKRLLNIEMFESLDTVMYRDEGNDTSGRRVIYVLWNVHKFRYFNKEIRDIAPNDTVRVLMKLSVNPANGRYKFSWIRLVDLSSEGTMYDSPDGYITGEDMYYLTKSQGVYDPSLLDLKRANAMADAYRAKWDADKKHACFIDGRQVTSDVLTSTQNSCEAAGGVWDSPCESDKQCPYFQANGNYPNTRGKCNVYSGMCELPEGLQRRSFRTAQTQKDNPNSVSVCHNCPTGSRFRLDRNDTCCEVQARGIAQRPIGGTGMNTPDYMFAGDWNDRQKYENELRAIGLGVD